VRLPVTGREGGRTEDREDEERRDVDVGKETM